MTPCRYKNYNQCTECNVVFYKQCEKFRRAHNNWLIQDLTPFPYSKVEFGNAKVYFSTDQDKIKSACARYAVTHNCKVKKYNLNQVLTFTLDRQELQHHEVVYIECDKKVSDSTDKIKSVIETFVDTQTFEGVVIFIYGTHIYKNQDWTQL